MPQLSMLKISTITVKDRTRQDYGDMDALTASVKDKGIIQPITVSADMKLLAGGRRLMAAKTLELLEIPALIRPVESEVDALEIELIENTMREDFSWAERSKLTRKIHEYLVSKDKNWRQEDTAKKLGVAVGKVNSHIKLADYVDAVPELSGLKTENDAMKGIKKMEEAIVIGELKRRHREAGPQGVTDLVRIADFNYKIGDVFKGLATLKDTPVDFIECDPPYGIDLHATKRKEGEVNPELDAYNEVDVGTYNEFLGKLGTALYTAAGEHCWMVFWFGPTWHSEVKQALEIAGWTVNDVPGIWNKGQGQTMQPNTNLANTYEPFFVCRKGSPVLRQQGRANVFTFPPVAGVKKYHPTQRPADLIDELLKTFAYPNSIVLSPFLGSGQTLLSVYQNDMKGFGWDLEEKYKDRFLVEVANAEK